MALLKVKILKKLRRNDGLITLICKVQNTKTETLVSSVISPEWGEIPKNGESAFLESIPTESGRILYSYQGGEELTDEIDDEEETKEEEEEQ